MIQQLENFQFNKQKGENQHMKQENLAPPLSRKQFIQESKVLKRKDHITADKARDELAGKYGYRNYDEMNSEMIELKIWNKHS